MTSPAADTSPAPARALPAFTARLSATTRRVLRQLRHDPRTIALMLVVPCLLLALLHWAFDASPETFDRVGPDLLGIFPMTVMFLVTSIATLRERTSGTLERLLSMPLRKTELILGYALAFGLLAVVQAGVATALMLGPLNLPLAGSAWLLLLVAVLDALLGTALGLFVSAFAATEFQAVQFMPAVIFPQMLLCGLFVPRDQMPSVLYDISKVLPMSYAVDAMAQVSAHATVSGDFVRDLAVIAGSALLVLVLGAATLRRRTP